MATNAMLPRGAAWKGDAAPPRAIATSVLAGTAVLAAQSLTVAVAGEVTVTDVDAVREVGREVHHAVRVEVVTSDPDAGVGWGAPNTSTDYAVGDGAGVVAFTGAAHVPHPVPPDAAVLVSLLATRQEPAPASLLHPERGALMLVGSVVVPLAALADGPVDVPLRAADSAGAGDAPAPPPRAQVHLRIPLLPTTPPLTFPADVLGARRARLARLAGEVDTRVARAMDRIGASPDVPEAPRCRFADMATPIGPVPGWLFAGDANGPAYLASMATAIDALFAMAILQREMERAPLAAHARARGDARLTRLLTHTPWDVPTGDLLALEEARVAALQPGVPRSNARSEVIAMMCVCLTKHATYLCDAVTCVAAAAAPHHHRCRHAACSRPARRLRVAEERPTDTYTDWVGAPGGYRGDCDDLANAARRLWSALATARALPPASVVLNSAWFAQARADIAPDRYVAGNVVGTAWAAKVAGAAAPPSAPVDGVRSGIEGHMWAFAMPCVPDGQHAHYTIEGTGLVSVTYAADPRRAHSAALLHDLVAQGDAFAALGLTGSSFVTYRAAAGDAGGAPQFYDAPVTLTGPDVARAYAAVGHAAWYGASAVPPGAVVTTVALTVPRAKSAARYPPAAPASELTRCMGVPLTVAVDPAACVARDVALAVVGYVTEEEAAAAAAIGRMQPADVAPAPHRAPGVRPGAAHDAPAVRLLAEALAATPVWPASRGPATAWVPIHVRLDRVTETWARALVAALRRCACVATATCLVEGVLDGLEGVVVAVGVTPRSL